MTWPYGVASQLACSCRAAVSDAASSYGQARSSLTVHGTSHPSTCSTPVLLVFPLPGFVYTIFNFILPLFRLVVVAS